MNLQLTFTAWNKLINDRWRCVEPDSCHQSRWCLLRDPLTIRNVDIHFNSSKYVGNILFPWQVFIIQKSTKATETVILLSSPPSKHLVAMEWRLIYTLLCILKFSSHSNIRSCASWFDWQGIQTIPSVQRCRSKENKPNDNSELEFIAIVTYFWAFIWNGQLCTGRVPSQRTINETNSILHFHFKDRLPFLERSISMWRPSYSDYVRIGLPWCTKLWHAFQRQMPGNGR